MKYIATLLLTAALPVASYGATPITAIVTNPLPDTNGNTQIESSGKILTSITTGGITYTNLNLADLSNLVGGGQSFIATDSTPPTAGDFPSTFYTTSDISEGRTNLTGDLFFESSYTAGDFIYLLEIGGNDTIDLTLIDAAGAPVSDVLTGVQVVNDTGYDLQFALSGSPGNVRDPQLIAGLALSEADFANITGTAAGINISGGNIDLVTAGHITIPEPSGAALISLVLFGGILRRRR